MDEPENLSEMMLSDLDFGHKDQAILQEQGSLKTLLRFRAHWA